MPFPELGIVIANATTEYKVLNSTPVRKKYYWPLDFQKIIVFWVCLFMIVILSLSDDDVVDGDHERLATPGLLHTPPPSLHTLVLMNGKLIYPHIQTSFAILRCPEKCWKRWLFGYYISPVYYTTATLVDILWLIILLFYCF